MTKNERTKRKAEKARPKNTRRGGRTEPRRTDAKAERKQDKDKVVDDETPEDSIVNTISPVRQKKEDVEREVVTRVCAGHGINPKCDGFLSVTARRHRLWCSESCRMYVNYKTRPEYKRKARKLYEKKRPPIQKSPKTEIVDSIPEVNNIAKDKTAVMEAAQKAMQASNDPLLKFLGNNGELIISVVKEFVSGFSATRQAQAQAQQVAQVRQTPQPPPFYGTLKALSFRDDPHWQAQAKAWEYYIVNSPHGQVNISRPPPTQYSVQPGAVPSVIEQSGARNLQEVARVSQALDAQVTPKQQVAPGMMSTDDMQKLEEYRKHNDPLADKMTKRPQETEVDMTMEQDQALINEKLQLLVGLFNGMSVEKVKEYAKDPDKAVKDLNETLKKPLIAMMISPYIPVIKNVGLNEFRQVFEENCKEKLQAFTDDEKDVFLMKLDEWRQRL